MANRATVLLPKIATTLRRIARSRSGNASSFSDLEARIIVELLLFGQLTMIRLVEILGNEKAQVSRTLGDLLKRGLIGRDSLRSPIVLTSPGEAMARTIVENAGADAARLLADLSSSERDVLTAVLPHFWRAAYALLATESELRNKGRGAILPQIDDRLMQESTRVDLLTLRIASVGTLLQRSFFLACRRLTGLAATELATLTTILDHGPLLGKELAMLEGRPKAQTDRTAHGLIRSGFVARTRALDSHDWIYQVRASQDEMGIKLRHELDRRERILLEDLSAPCAAEAVSVLQRIFIRISSQAISGA